MDSAQFRDSALGSHWMGLGTLDRERSGPWRVRTASRGRFPQNIITAFYNADVYSSTSIHIDPIPPQLFPRYFNLPHQLLMCLRYIIEREDAQPQLEQQVRSKRDEGPERELVLQTTSGLQESWWLHGKGREGKGRERVESVRLV